MYRCHFSLYVVHIPWALSSKVLSQVQIWHHWHNVGSYQWLLRTPLVPRDSRCSANPTDLFFDVFRWNICTSLSNFPERQFSAVSCSFAIRLDWHASFSVAATNKNISSSASSPDCRLQELFFILHSVRQPLDGTVSIQFFFWKN